MNSHQRSILAVALLAAALLANQGQGVEFEVHPGWSDQLFPSFIVSTATIRIPDEALDDHDDELLLGDRQGLLGVSIEAEEDETEVTVTISCDAIMEPSTYSVTLPAAGVTHAIFPKIKYKYDALLKHRQAGPVTVTFSVAVGEEDAEEESRTLTLRSINDCPYTVVDEDDTRDISFVFAAYVNEDHPFVDKLLREGLDTGVVSSFSGYQAGDKADVYRQVYALWHALSQRDLRYSSITTTTAETDGISSQHVRLIDDSINNAQANCVDGSVLLASLLRKVGIEPVLVMVPGHCYLAFQTDAAGEEIVGLETTLLGAEVEKAAGIPGVKGVVEKEQQAENSWKTFTAALAMGTKDLKANQKKFAAADNADYQLIGIAKARKLGILPLAFKSGERFKPAPKVVEPAADDE